MSIGNLGDYFFDFACYIKPYESNLHKGNQVDRVVRFYDEREWRYVSRFLQGDYQYGLSKADFESDEIRGTAAQYIFDHEKVEFEPSDVKYIIVSEDDEILPLIHEIDRIKGRFSHDQVRILSSRILTSKQVLSDF